MIVLCELSESVLEGLPLARSRFSHFLFHRRWALQIVSDNVGR
jgi:hypothetical protein